MKFIHTADIHLDSPLSGLATYQNIPVDLLRTATRDAFTNLVDEAIAEAVDFLIIAGDLYDGTWKDYNTGFYFSREMGRLNKAGIPVYLLLGNHDAESEMTRRLLLPLNVHQFDSRKPTTYRLEKCHVALHGRSFKHAATMENLVTTYPEPIPGWINIGVLHTALEGSSAHANYAPCSLAELSAKGYNYWALGHVHEYATLQQDPCWVVFPGNLQGRHIREPGAKGAVLVTADETGILSVERLLVDVLRWHRIDVDVCDATDLEDVIRLTGQKFEQLIAEDQDGKPMTVRVTLSGKTAAHGDLFGLESHLRAEILAQAAAIGSDKLWVEKVHVETQPMMEPIEIKARADAIADLQDLLEEAPFDLALLKDLEKELQLLVGKAPYELTEAVPAFTEIRNGELAQLVKTVSPGLIAYLAQSEQD
ncbi:MAG: DNA repair exonuclease [Nitrosomonas sp.]|nr:DNA repair exonuclease [Nitrosomonas sp.]MDP1951727.1 DNA repair exonuclease [Nitrosomonas sp.]